MQKKQQLSKAKKKKRTRTRKVRQKCQQILFFGRLARSFARQGHAFAVENNCRLTGRGSQQRTAVCSHLVFYYTVRKKKKKNRGGGGLRLTFVRAMLERDFHARPRGESAFNSSRKPFPRLNKWKKKEGEKQRRVAADALELYNYLVLILYFEVGSIRRTWFHFYTPLAASYIHHTSRTQTQDNGRCSKLNLSPPPPPPPPTLERVVHTLSYYLASPTEKNDAPGPSPSEA